MIFNISQQSHTIGIIICFVLKIDGETEAHKGCDLTKVKMLWTFIIWDCLTFLFFKSHHAFPPLMGLPITAQSVLSI